MTSTVPPGVAVVVVPTRGPSAHLARLLDALGRGAMPVEVLVDDPSDAAAEAVRALVPAGPAPVRVVGGRERAAFEAALGGASGRVDGVTAALGAADGDPWRVGALRNLALLRAAGRCAVSIDDDVVPEVRPPPEGGAGLRRVHGLDPTCLHACVDREEALAGTVPTDVVALHAEVIGRSVGELVREADVTDPDLRDGVDGRVVVSSLGIAGDAGIGRASTWLAVPPATRVAMTARWPEGLWSRSVVRAAPALTLADAPFFMAPCFAFDGSALLPPFLPRHRNTDGLWGLCLARHARPGLVAHLPWAVRHDPPARRRFAEGDLARHVVAFRTTDLVALLVAAAAPRGATPAERVVALGGHMGAVAALGDRELADVVGTLSAKWLATMGAAVARARAEPGPDGWHAELDLAADALRRTAVAFPDEHARDGVDDVAGLRADLDRFAVALDAWPALAAAAAELVG